MNMFELLKSSKGLAVSDSYTALLGRKISGSGSFPEAEITGMTPLTFLSNGDAINDWTIYGKTVQNGTPTPDDPIDIQGVGDRTANLCPMIFSNTGAVDDSGRIGSYNTRLWSEKIPVSASQSYHVVIDGKASNGEDLRINRAIQYDENGNFISRISPGILKEATFTTSENCRFVVLDLRTSSLTVDISVSDISTIMLNLGSTALPYEPYGYKVTATNRGKNLFDIVSTAEQTKSGVSLKIENGILKANGVCTSSANFSHSYQLKAGSYTLKANASKNPSEDSNYCIQFYNADPPLSKGVYNSNAKDGYVSFSIESDLLVDFRFRVQQGVNYDGFEVRPQLELGSTATPYEPYREPITTTLYTDKPLYGTGTKLDYLQRLADGSGVEHREWGVYQCTGNENVTAYVGYDAQNCYYVSVSGLGVNTSGFCSHYQSVGSLAQWIATAFSFMISTNTLRIHDSNVGDVDGMKSYLAAQYAAGTPVTVVYQLATPTDAPVTLPEIQTAVGTNTIDTDTTVHGDARIKGRIKEVEDSAMRDLLNLMEDM